MIRAGAILQLLLGNVGRPGGGVLAMRGHASIQGSTDIPTLYDLLPGYLHMPRAREQELTLDAYIDTGGARRGWWSHFPTYIVSLLKAWFGDAATAENDYGFAHLPKISGNHSHYPTMLRRARRRPARDVRDGPEPGRRVRERGVQRRALSRLKWLVVRELTETETASFWKDAPEVRSGELKTEEIGTEVFLMPAATHIEKEGCFTNTERLVQWRDKALDPPATAARSCGSCTTCSSACARTTRSSTDDRDWPIRNLAWDYPEHGAHAEPSADEVLREINGYDVTTGELVSGFADLADDGSTACGCWIYSGIYAEGVNQARRREPGDFSKPGGWVAPEWGWAWPANRRVLYSRASADPDGRPWSERKRYVWWDGEKSTGYDVPDFPVDKPPGYVAPDDAEGMDAISGSDPFIMQADGRGWLFSPAGLLDGPLPTHYEPLESPVENRLYPEIDENPAALRWDRADNPVADIGDPRYPVVATTFRVTEHHTAGGMSRWVPWLAELQPEMFAEIDPVLAREHGIEDGGWMTICSPRAEIEARAKVTDRIKPLRLGDRVVHQVGLPWHWGFGGPSPGDSANDIDVLSATPTSRSRSRRRSSATSARAAKTVGTAKLAGVRDTPPGVAVNRDHPAEVRPHR